MLVADISRRVREVSGDSGALQFSHATLTDWMNDGIRECVQQNSLLQGTASSPSVVGQQDYSLPVDIFKLHSVYFGTDKLRVITLSESDDLQLAEMGSRNGTPVYATMYAGVLSITPKPDSIKNIVIKYTKQAAEIALTDPTIPTWVPTATPIPVQFHNRIVTYCLAQVALQDDDYAKYQALMAEFTTGVVDLNHLQDQTENLYPSLHFVDRDLEY